MIKKITINYPTFWTNGLVLEKEFTKGINIIEEENWYGKSTILNTIMSSYTFSYPWMRTLPKWSASITTDKDNLILSKKNWIGTTHEWNELYKYTMPWKFFEIKSTTDQRKILVDLLWLDYKSFMITECAKNNLSWDENIESNLNKKLKEDTMLSELLAADIMRYTAEIRDVPEEDFSDIDKFYADQKLIEEKTREHNKWILSRQSNYNSLLRDRDSLNNTINQKRAEVNRLVDCNLWIDSQLDSLRTTYKQNETAASCDKCWSKLDGNNLKNLLEWIIQTANKLKAQKNSNKNSITDILKEKSLLVNKLNDTNAQIDSFDTNFNVLSFDDILWNAKKFWIEFKWISENRLKELEIYKDALSKVDRIKQELSRKQKEMKEINILTTSNSIEVIKNIKSSFTTMLEEATKALELDIQLFEMQKNWVVKETFTVNYNGIDFYDLSTWNKSLVNIMMAKLFVDKLSMDVILIDEWSLISKSNIDYIKALSKHYQVIICKATNWLPKDFK